ncbi:MAG: hypothetical protein ACTSUF_10175 [Candidatus Heimdallarchaeaceae archaeon]
MKDKQLWELCMNIYRELYKKATPSADLDELIKSGETKKENWFRKYYLSQKDIIRIMNKHMKGKRLSRFERNAVRMEILLGSSPSSYQG